MGAFGERAHAFAMSIVERNIVPDAVLRAFIRRNCRKKCLEKFANTEDELEREQAFIDDLRAREAIAEETSKANEQVGNDR